eukprot:6458175-Amphidinium_carterae.1
MEIRDLELEARTKLEMGDAEPYTGRTDGCPKDAVTREACILANQSELDANLANHKSPGTGSCPPSYNAAHNIHISGHGASVAISCCVLAVSDMYLSLLASQISCLRAAVADIALCHSIGKACAQWIAVACRCQEWVSNPRLRAGLGSSLRCPMTRRMHRLPNVPRPAPSFANSVGLQRVTRSKILVDLFVSVVRVKAASEGNCVNIFLSASPCCNDP